ncbi:MAG: AgmX/PglI C-terminal domain-containing protein [Bacteriovoracia bacterium]
MALIVFLLVAICTLTGVLIGKNLVSTSTPSQLDDGKIAKEYKERSLVKVIRDNAKDLQKCYLDFLATRPTMQEGDIEIVVEVEEDGEIDSAKIIKNDFNNGDFESCLSDKLEDYHLPPPPLGINRYLSHTLSFKSEETALREAKERKEKEKLPKLIPINSKK